MQLVLTPHQSSAAVSEPSLPSGTQVAEYVIDEVIGRGGMSIVYGARHPVIGSRVAIKVLSMDRHDDPESVSRFIQEARTANEIRHRNIVGVYTIGRLANGQVYCVMEHLDGTSLAHHLRIKGPMAIADALRVLDTIARALDAAHAKGVVHRDIKPGNIFLVRDPETGELTRAKLLDFGVAKLLATSSISPEHHTKTGSVIGTPAYMAPEQWGGSDVGPRADVYSFGAVAYQMLTGRLPYTADNFGELLFHQQTQLPTPASQLVRDLPTALDAVLYRALHKDADARFAKASDLVAAIASATSLSALVGVPTDPEMNALTPARRPRLWIPIALGAAAIAGCAAFALVSWHSGEPTAAAATRADTSSVVEHTTPRHEGATAPTPVMVKIRFVGDPAGAAIADATGKVVGSLGEPIEVPLGARALQFHVSAAGYASQTFDVVSDRSQDIAVTLVKPVKPSSLHRTAAVDPGRATAPKQRPVPAEHPTERASAVVSDMPVKF